MIFGNLHHSGNVHLLLLGAERLVACIQGPGPPKQNANVRHSANSAEAQTHSRMDVNVTVACRLDFRGLQLRD